VLLISWALQPGRLALVLPRIRGQSALRG
jgi:hypothetical protein